MELNTWRGPKVIDKGPPLVLLHGFSLHAGVWVKQMEGLARRWPLIAVDLRGFGASASVHGQTSPSIDVMAGDVEETLCNLGVTRAIVCGLSMGGYVSMALARRAPGLVAGLVLVDTKQEADSAARGRERERVAQIVEVEQSVRVIQDEVAPRFTGATTKKMRPAVQDAVDELVRATPYRAAAWASRAMASRQDSAESLRAFEGPALVVVGDEDVVSPPEGARSMVAGLKDGSFACLPTAGHLSPLETPSAFDACVLAWLEARVKVGS